METEERSNPIGGYNLATSTRERREIKWRPKRDQIRLADTIWSQAREKGERSNADRREIKSDWKMKSGHKHERKERDQMETEEKSNPVGR